MAKEQFRTPRSKNRHRAWWLVTQRHRAEWQALKATGAALFTGRPRHHIEAAKSGDPVFLYLSKPDHAVVAMGVIAEAPRASTAHTAPASPTAPALLNPQLEVQLAFETPNRVTWHTITQEPELANSEPVRQRSSGALFALDEREYSALQLLVVESNPELAAAFSSLDAGSYVAGRPENAVADAEDSAIILQQVEVGIESGQGRLREAPALYAPANIRGTGALPRVQNLAELQALTGLPLEMLEEARDLLDEAGQIVLAGPPGTGKTWLARGLAALFAGDPARAQVVQFHPSTTYEDFIEGLKPLVDASGGVTYAVVPGVFKKLCWAARRDPEQPYVLVIDEINRAPLAQVFGELLYALEYRGPHGTVQLSSPISGLNEQLYSETETGSGFYVPDNMFIIGTMNTADRSLAGMDYALRRRFRFIEMQPDAGVLERWLRQQGAPEATEAQRKIMLALFSQVNARLAELLDPDHRLGHSYFMRDPLNADMLDRLWRTSVKPLLSEYFIPPMGEIDDFAQMFRAAGEKMRDA